MAREDKRDEPVWVRPPLRRFRRDFRPPRSPPPCRQEGLSEGIATPALEYEWAGGWTMHAGSVVHRWLQIIAQQGLAAFDRSHLLSLQPRFRRQLEQLGTAPADVDRATERVMAALCRATTDERGRWILSGDHAHAECELALMVREGELFRQLVIDRTFVAADGTCWIIDYKTSTHEGGDLDVFLASESERHAGQLHRYRDALAAFKAEPIRTALYYPMLAVFLEVDASAPACR
jgi:ATP-dependent exoDNAse (exonuclease V) beta subunit